MAVPPIGPEDGIQALRAAGERLEPGRVWPAKIEQTLETLKAGHNDAQQRLAALEERLLRRPFS